MKRIVMYTSGKLFQERQTGGIKRFMELTKFFAREFTQTILYSQDDDEVATQLGIKHFVKMRKADPFYRRIPPEAALLLTNRKVIKQLRKSDYDCLVVFDAPTAIGVVLYGLKNIVLMIRKDMIGCELVNLQDRWYKSSFKLFYQWVSEAFCLWKAKSVVCQCIYDKNVLMGRHPLLASLIDKKIKILINNVNPSWIISNSEQESELPTTVPIKSSRFRICFIGGFDDSIKGQDLFLETASELLIQRMDLEFVLIGGGFKLEEYKQMYTHENIFFTGRLKNPIKVLKTSDLLVVPSWSDSCPNTVLEALYNEIAVIGSKAGGIPEILIDKDSLFDLNKVSLKESILRFVEDNHALKLLRDRQLKRKKELTFDWAQLMAELVLE